MDPQKVWQIILSDTQQSLGVGTTWGPPSPSLQEFLWAQSIGARGSVASVGECFFGIHAGRCPGLVTYQESVGNSSGRRSWNGIWGRESGYSHRVTVWSLQNLPSGFCCAGQGLNTFVRQKQFGWMSLNKYLQIRSIYQFLISRQKKMRLKDLEACLQPIQGFSESASTSTYSDISFSFINWFSVRLNTNVNVSQQNLGSPKPELEQYVSLRKMTLNLVSSQPGSYLWLLWHTCFEKIKVTSAHLASRMLFTAHSSYQDIDSRSILDLGCGCGILSIASHLLGST